MTRKDSIARVLISCVFAINVMCALQFIFTPGDFVFAYQLEGTAAEPALQGLGIAFLMWNATYPPVIVGPRRYRVLFAVVIAQQTIGLVGESLLLLSLDPSLAILASSVVRFIVFDGTGLVVLIVSFLLTRGTMRCA